MSSHRDRITPVVPAQVETADAYLTHVAYGDPDTTTDDEDTDALLACGCWAERTRTDGHEPWCDYHDQGGPS